mmetsp:Transcript_5865/g.24876  ORF Transcript_5865/g.24876 Transcript_5865/m.24876 type:complete len:308 (+) Transcript_5865:280-1203(+)
MACAVSAVPTTPAPTTEATPNHAKRFRREETRVARAFWTLVVSARRAPNPLRPSTPKPAAAAAAVSEYPGWSHHPTASRPKRKRAPSSVHSSGVNASAESNRLTLLCSRTVRHSRFTPRTCAAPTTPTTRRGATRSPFLETAPDALRYRECANTKSRSARRVWSIAHPPEYDTRPSVGVPLVVFSVSVSVSVHVASPSKVPCFSRYASERTSSTTFAAHARTASRSSGSGSACITRCHAPRSAPRASHPASAIKRTAASGVGTGAGRSEPSGNVTETGARVFFVLFCRVVAERRSPLGIALRAFCLR